MRPTRAAFMLASTAAACVALGLVFGRIELFIFAGVCITSFLTALIYVVFTPLNLTVQRETSPNTLRVRSEAKVGLTIHNKGRFRTPVMRALDQLEHFQGASVHVAPIRSGQETEIRYELPTERRGEISFGPFDLIVTDPFGLVKTTVRAAGITQTVVRPRMIDLAVIPTAGGPLIGEVSSQQKLSPSGDEFVRLRPYVVGDELRRVHWRASARSGDLVVRQNEETKTGVLSVLFDLTAHRYSNEGFERAVSAAVSAVRAGSMSEDQLHYMTSASPPTRVESAAGFEAVDLQLSLVEPTDSGSMVNAIGELGRRARSGGTLVLITGQNDGEIQKVVALAKETFGQVLVILCEAAASKPPFWHIRHDGTTDLSLGWAAALQGLR